MNLVMVEGSKKSTVVRKKLLRAAERIFADRGFRAMTIRDVTREVRVNVAAVNYHFGSKRDLMRAVVEERFGPVNRLRISMIEKASREHAPQPIPVAAIMDIMIRPLFALARASTETSGNIIIKMMGRCFAEPADFIREMNEEFFSEVRERFLFELRRSLPEQNPERVRASFFLAVATVVGTIGDGGAMRFESPEMGGTLENEQAVEDLVRFVTGGLLG